MTMRCHCDCQFGCHCGDRPGQSLPLLLSILTRLFAPPPFSPLSPPQAGWLLDTYGVVLSLEARSTAGLTPMLFAAKNGKTRMFRWLLERGADFEASDTVRRLFALLCACVRNRVV